MRGRSAAIGTSSSVVLGFGARIRQFQNSGTVLLCHISVSVSWASLRVSSGQDLNILAVKPDRPGTVFGLVCLTAAMNSSKVGGVDVSVCVVGEFVCD